MTVTHRTLRTPLAETALSQTPGAGLPILLIHGSGFSRNVFQRQLEGPLASRHRLIAFDLPGHGKSSDARDPASAYTVHGLARAAAWVLDGLCIERAVVYGWSLGGHVAIELATFHPAVAGLMLTGTPPIARGPLGMLRGFHVNWDMLLASKSVFSARDAERFEKLCFGDAAEPSFREDLLRADGRVRTTAIRSMFGGQGADQKQFVEAAPFPVAIVNGENDPFIRLSYLEQLNYGSLWEHCHVLPEVGHAAFFERPDVFDPILARFCHAVECGAATLAPSENHSRLA